MSGIVYDDDVDGTKSTTQNMRFGFGMKIKRMIRMPGQYCLFFCLAITASLGCPRMPVICAQDVPVIRARDISINQQQEVPIYKPQDLPLIRPVPIVKPQDFAYGDDHISRGRRYAGQWRFEEETKAEFARYLVQTDNRQSSAQQQESATIARGRAAFNSSCTTCHDANRSLEKAKSYAGWLSTVRRMARKTDADIPSADIVPIARYLASLSQPARGAQEPMQAAESDESESDESDQTDEPTAAEEEPDLSEIEQSQVSIYGTVSPLWRGTNDEQRLENPDFFVDAWLGASWQSDGAISVTATVCTSCHSFRSPNSGFTMEFVEASVSVNLNRLRGKDEDVCFLKGLWDANIKAGRFVVPFGAYGAMSNPSVNHTLSHPLMFNMGRRVGQINRQPVLPQPYADEGVDISVRARYCDKISATLNVFAVNGLQHAGPGINFTLSRQYVDNNREPAVGFRTTLGSNVLRVGGSIMSGTAQDDGNPQINYRLSGVDAVLRVKDKIRFYFEYAIRTEDSIFVPGQQNHTYGIVTECEFDIPCTKNLSFLLRYDTLELRDAFFAFPDLTQERGTWGLTKMLPGGSLLMFNHEHWLLAPDDVDVIGIRWSTTF